MLCSPYSAYFTYRLFCSFLIHRLILFLLKIIFIPPHVCSIFLIFCLHCICHIIIIWGVGELQELPRTNRIYHYLWCCNKRRFGNFSIMTLKKFWFLLIWCMKFAFPHISHFRSPLHHPHLSLEAEGIISNHTFRLSLIQYSGMCNHITGIGGD